MNSDPCCLSLAKERSEISFNFFQQIWVMAFWFESDLSEIISSSLFSYSKLFFETTCAPNETILEKSTTKHRFKMI